MTKKQKSFFDKVLQIITHQADRSPVGLSKYDTVILGRDFAVMTSKKVAKITHGHSTMFFQSPNRDIFLRELRILSETRKCDGSAYKLGIGETVEISAAKDNANHVVKIEPEKSKLIFRNGNSIEYGSLILDSGLEYDFDAIPGLEEGLNQPHGSVFSPYHYSLNLQPYNFFPNFSQGNAFIYLPEFPFHNEVENLNFLIALDTWEAQEKMGIISPLRNLTIVNANDRFASHCGHLDKFIRERLGRHSKVDVLMKSKLQRIDNAQKKLTVVDKDGTAREMDFERIYVHIPTKADPLMAESGFLKAGKKQVAVNPKTLQYSHYDNVFCIGDGIDLPIQTSFYASVRQSRVAVHNSLERIHGRSASAEYNLETKLPIFTGKENASFYKSTAGSEPTFTSPIFEKLVYKYLCMFWAGALKKTYTGKSAGPGLRFASKFKKGEALGTAPGHSGH